MVLFFCNSCNAYDIMEYMNPSYDNNSVGNSNSGGTNPGGVGGAIGGNQPVVGLNQPVSPVVQPVVGAAPQPTPPVQPQDQFGQFGQQPMMSSEMNSPINSGEGDIYLGGNSSEKKSKKGLIIGVVIIIILAIVAGIVAILMNSGMFEKSEQQKESDLATAYNSFANYVMYGEDSTERVNFNEIGNKVPYFETLERDNNGEYIEKAQKYYNKLEEAFNEYMVNNENVEAGKNGEATEEVTEETVEDDTKNENSDGITIEEEMKEFYDNQYGGISGIEVLKSYYVDYIKVKPLELRELIEGYTLGGISDVNKLIRDRYTISDSEYEIYLDTYLNKMKKIASLELDIIVAYSDAGCISNNEIIEGCYAITAEQENELEGALNDAVYALMILKNSALQTMRSLFYLLYGVTGIDESMEDV